MKLWNKKKETPKDKIIKSKEIIKEEKRKIKQEKKKLTKEKINQIKEKQKQRKEDKNSKKENNKQKKIPVLKLENYTPREVVITIIISMVIGALACLAVLYIIFGKNIITSYKDLSKLIDTYTTITNNYYGDLDKEQLVDDAINAMLESVGDTFTTYSDNETAETFLENVDGTYEGIGCTVTTTEDGKIEIVSLFEDSPSEKAGLQEGDIIIKVDGTSYENKTSTDVANYIKNNQNKKIKITILRDNEEKEITVTRKKIEVPVVESEIYEQSGHKIGYISISIFSSVSNTQFENALKELEKDNIEGLVIDVRDNGGGYLSSVTDIASLFLAKGKVIYQLENEKKTEKIKDTTKTKRTYPVAVLINNSSASASEILASAIKESYKGLVVGTNSYGKGTVQQTKKLSDGSMIKYTTQNWLTPNGNWINKVGVEPTDYVELDGTEEDNQLKKALDLLIEKLS